MEYDRGMLKVAQYLTARSFGKRLISLQTAINIFESTVSAVWQLPWSIMCWMMEAAWKDGSVCSTWPASLTKHFVRGSSIRWTMRNVAPSRRQKDRRAVCKQKLQCPRKEGKKSARTHSLNQKSFTELEKQNKCWTSTVNISRLQSLGLCVEGMLSVM